MRRASAALAIGIWALLATVWLLGFERVYVGAHCHAWHLLHAPEVQIENVEIDVPAGWCPTTRGEDVLLAKTPDTSTDDTLVVLLSPLLGVFADAARQPEGVEQIAGMKVRVAEPPQTGLVGGIEATKLVHETIEAPSQRTIAWIFRQRRSSS